MASNTQRYKFHVALKCIDLHNCIAFYNLTLGVTETPFAIVVHETEANLFRSRVEVGYNNIEGTEISVSL
jgi:hypothetical protein